MKGCCLAAIKGSCLAALYPACDSCLARASGEGGAEAAAVYSVGGGTNSIVVVPSSEDFEETELCAAGVGIVTQLLLWRACYATPRETPDFSESFHVSSRSAIERSAEARSEVKAPSPPWSTYVGEVEIPLVPILGREETNIFGAETRR